jgi:hypothetical protein
MKVKRMVYEEEDGFYSEISFPTQHPPIHRICLLSKFFLFFPFHIFPTFSPFSLPLQAVHEVVNSFNSRKPVKKCNLLKNFTTLTSLKEKRHSFVNNLPDSSLSIVLLKILEQSEISWSQDVEDFKCHLVGCDAVWSCMWLPTFRRNISSSSVGLKVASVISST